MLKDKMTITHEDLSFRFTANRLCRDLASAMGDRGHRNIESLNGPDDSSVGRLTRAC
jgi:hypothetical protein